MLAGPVRDSCASMPDPSTSIGSCRRYSQVARHAVHDRPTSTHASSVSGHQDLPTGGHEPDDEINHVGWRNLWPDSVSPLAFAQDECDPTPFIAAASWLNCTVCRCALPGADHICIAGSSAGRLTVGRERYELMAIPCGWVLTAIDRPDSGKCHLTKLAR
jgi:hypothetical protein